MEDHDTKIFSLLCFASIFLSCLSKHVAPVSTESFAPLVGITKSQGVSDARGSSSAQIIRRPFLRGKRRFLIGGGYYGGPNFPCRHYETWYNNRYHVPYNFNKRTYFGRGPINIPFHLPHKNQHLFNGMSTLPRHIATEYPFAGRGNQVRVDYNGNFFPVHHSFDQYDEVNSFNHQVLFNGDSHLNERPYNGEENVVFDGTNINQDESSEGHAIGEIVIKQPTTVIESISNSTPEKQDLSVDGGNVIEENVISHNVITNDAKEGSTNDEFISKDDSIVDTKLNNEESGLVSDEVGLEENAISKEGASYTYSVNPNLTLNSILDGKLLEKYISYEVSLQTDDEELNQNLNSGGNKGTRYYIVKGVGSLQDDSKTYSGYRRILVPFYGGNSAYGNLGTYIGQSTGFNNGGARGVGAGFSSGAEFYGGNSAYGGSGTYIGQYTGFNNGYSNGAAVSIGGGTQNSAGIYQSVSANGALSVGTGSGINGISSNGGVSVSGQVENGISGGYSSVRGEASISRGVSVGNGAGFGGGFGIGRVPSFGGGGIIGGEQNIGSTAGFNGASINNLAGFSGGSYQVPSQMNYIYRKAL